MLIQEGADVNSPRAKYGGRTALEGAAEHGRLDMVQLLLDVGADIGGNYAKSAKELAESNGHTVIAQILSNF
jgi:ankyrin repeat protein